MSEEMYELLRRRDAELVALRQYVASVEEELREARGDSAHQFAREDADEKLRALRYQHGFKTDGRWRDA